MLVTCTAPPRGVWCFIRWCLVFCGASPSDVRAQHQAIGMAIAFAVVQGLQTPIGSLVPLLF